MSDLGRSLRVGDIVPQRPHKVLEVNDQEIILRCMPHECGVLFLFRDDYGYSHIGVAIPTTRDATPASFDLRRIVEASLPRPVTVTVAQASAGPVRVCRLGLPARPRNGGDVFRYRLHSPDGDHLGEATYAVMIKPGEGIHLGAGERFRVLDVVAFGEEDGSPFVGLLQVEAV